MKNKLYHFIFHDLYTETAYLSKKYFHFSANKDNHDFVLYQLPAETKILNDQDQQYTLCSHHISFYKYQDDHNPYLRDHYTAYFQNKDNKKFRLHVYFDRNDKLAMAPVFSIENEDEGYTKLDIDSHFAAELADLANDNTTYLLTTLRCQRKAVMESMEERHKKLEVELTALSLDLKSNHDSYQKNLNHIIEIVTVLADIHDNPLYPKLSTLYINRADYFNQPLNQTEDNIEEAEDLEFNDSENTLNTKREKKQSINNLYVIDFKNEALELIKKAQGAQARFISVDKLYYADQVKYFLDYDLAVNEAYVIVEEKNKCLIPEIFNQIQFLISNVADEGRKLIERLILQGEYELASSLKRFMFNPTKLIELALKTSNANMLDFLLSLNIFPVNTFSVFNNISPVLYCGDEKSPKVDCLSILIKHHASIMVEDANGLPLALKILITFKDPLKKALIDNADETLSRSHFHQTMIRHIDKILRRESLDETLIKRLSLTKDYCFSMLEKCAGYKSAADHYLIKREINTINQIKEQCDKLELELLETDTEVLAKTKEYQQLIKQYSNKMPKKEKRKLVIQDNNIVKSLSGMCISLHSKENIIASLDTYIEIMRIKLEILDLQFLRKNSKRKPSQRELYLIEQLKEKDKKHNIEKTLAQERAIQTKIADLEKQILVKPNLTDKEISVLSKDLVTSLTKFGVLRKTEEKNAAKEMEEMIRSAHKLKNP